MAILIISVLKMWLLVIWLFWYSRIAFFCYFALFEPLIINILAIFKLQFLAILIISVFLKVQFWLFWAFWNLWLIEKCWRPEVKFEIIAGFMVLKLKLWPYFQKLRLGPYSYKVDFRLQCLLLSRSQISPQISWENTRSSSRVVITP